MEYNEVITISRFKATCLAVIDKVHRTGQPVLVTRRGQPVALIEPPPPPKAERSWLGSYKDRGKIVGDILAPATGENEWDVLNG